MTSRIAITRQGIDVLGTAGTIPNNLIADSNQNTFKIITHGTALGTIASSTTGTVVIPHGQTYIPQADAFARRSDGTLVVGSSGEVPFPLGSFQLRSVASDSANILVEIRNNNFSSGTFIVSYLAYEVPI
jgi:hypothetical protein